MERITRNIEKLQYNSVNAHHRGVNNNNTNMYILFVVFLINPLISCLMSFYLVGKGNKSRYPLLFISLFFGLLAFTQYTEIGDMSRTYSSIKQSINLMDSNFSLFLLSVIKSPVFYIISILVSKLTGNIQYISLIWGTLVYFFIYLSIENLFKYFKLNDTNRLKVYLVTIICFVIFVENMELLKQAVATSMVFLSLSFFLLRDYKKSIIIYLLSFGIHLASMFYLPLFFAFYLGFSTVSIFFLLSFFLRFFNLMSYVVVFFQQIGLSAYAEVAQGYSESFDTGFRSGAVYFVLAFVVLQSIVLLHCFLNNKKNIISKISLLFIVVLNLNYQNDHNFTRLILFSYPIYILIYMDFLSNNIRLKNIRAQLLSLIIISTLFLNVYISKDRYSTKSSPAAYTTSFMNNSLWDISTSSIYGYLSYKVPID